MNKNREKKEGEEQEEEEEEEKQEAGDEDEQMVCVCCLLSGISLHLFTWGSLAYSYVALRASSLLGSVMRECHPPN